MSDMKCPNCISLYLTESFDSQGKVHLDRCPKCKGIWFDHKELEKLFTAASKDLTVQPDARESGLVCPHCGKSLFSFSYPQTLVKVDMCRNCKGIWLDMGEWTELRKVRDHLDRTGELEEFAPLTGIKGGLIRMIDAAISSLKTFD